MTSEEIMTIYGKQMYKLGLEYAIAMIDIADITGLDLKLTLKEKIEMEYGNE